MKLAGVFVVLFLSLVAQTGWAQRVAAPEPSRGLMPNPTRGKPLYEANCATCHGESLTGTDKGPAFLHRVYVPEHHGDAAFQLAVRNGSRQHHWKFGDMAPVPGLSADDVAHITAYVRARQRRAGVQ
ncbi:MAG: c-type cytochrome [Burkholderiaceae bacterium]|nr:c-type cytochrome [Burkholderiaceae bacterium]